MSHCVSVQQVVDHMHGYKKLHLSTLKSAVPKLIYEAQPFRCEQLLTDHWGSVPMCKMLGELSYVLILYVLKAPVLQW